MPMLCWCSVYCSNLSRMTHDQCCLKAKCSSCWQNKPGALIIVFCLQKLVWHGLFAKFKPVPKLETDWCFQLKDDESTRLHNGSLKRSNRVAPEVLQRKACFPQPNGTNTCVSQLSSGEAHIDQCLRRKYRHRIEFCQVKSQHTEQYRTRTDISLANRLELWISTLNNLNSFLSLLEVLHSWWNNWDKTDPWVLDSPNAKRRALIEKPPSKSCSAEYPQSLSSPREKPASLKS
jgi:hypothetical protein